MEQASEALNSYMEVLSKYGYVPNKESEILICYLILLEILYYSDFSKYVNQDDFNLIKNNLNCLAINSCFILNNINKSNIKMSPSFGLLDLNNAQFTEYKSLLDLDSNYEFFIVKK